MPRVTISNIDFKDLKTKKGDPYIKVNDKYTVFDYALINRFRLAKGSSLSVEVTYNGQYANIRQIYDEDEPIPVVKPSMTPTPVVRLNCRTWGPREDQIRIYFSDFADLITQMRDLRDNDMMPATWYEHQKPVVLVKDE